MLVGRTPRDVREAPGRPDAFPVSASAIAEADTVLTVP